MEIVIYISNFRSIFFPFLYFIEYIFKSVSFLYIPPDIQLGSLDLTSSLMNFLYFHISTDYILSFGIIR